jgi:homoserine kinase
VADFRSGPVRVRVPGSSANLGPAFDYAGLALGIYDELEAEVVPDGELSVTVYGESADRVPLDRRHMVVRAMDDTFNAMGIEPPAGLRLIANNAIPHGRGLGSSAAAIAAGIVLARGLVDGGAERFSDAQVLDLGTRLEGHPDNISASLFGGFTIAWVDDAGAHHVSLKVDESVVPVVVIPGGTLPTKKARAMLPSEVPHADAAFNAGRAALLVHALTTQPELLLAATDDRLHQQQRRSAMPDSLDVVDALRAAGIPAAVSGAGPCVLAFATASSAPLVAGLVGEANVTLQLPVAYDGALAPVKI